MISFRSLKPSDSLRDHYLEYRFSADPREPATEILIAELGDIGFESFIETEEGVLAYIPAEAWDPGSLHEVEILRHPDFTIRFEVTEIPQENWNAVWEENFEPIRVGNACVVRAPFHQNPGVKYDIVIEPKMSFGTGHHETTYMMLQLLLDFNCEGLSVLDMGCGTGVLAILAAMKGAAEVDAIDTDSWSYQNALENCKRNGQTQIQVDQGDARLLKEKKYSLIMANINRNVLLSDIPEYSKALQPTGVLMLSGFYTEDLPMISEMCRKHNLHFLRKLEVNNWQAAVYRLS